MSTKTSSAATQREAILDFFERNPSAKVRAAAIGKALKLNGTTCAGTLNRMCSAAGSRLKRKMVQISDQEKGPGIHGEQYLYWMEAAAVAPVVVKPAIVESPATELPIPSKHAGTPAYKGIAKLSPRAQDAILGCPEIPDNSKTSTPVALVPNPVTAPVIEAESATPVVDPGVSQADTAIEADTEPQEALIVDPGTAHVFDKGLLEIHLAAIHHKDVAIAALEADLAAEVERTGRARAKATAAEAQSERLIEELHALKSTIMQRPPVAIQPPSAIDPDGYVVGDHGNVERFGLACQAQERAFQIATETRLPAPVYALHLVGQVVPVVSVEWRDAAPAVAA